ncbi:MAG: glycosyltransferase family 4 protein [Chloroflexi bacterium]|nr:glycosyltransferase family 4 protein [Chloroflexota bacterium]
MKTLMLAGRFPVPPDSGGSLRVYHLLRLLSSRHELHLIAAHPGPPPPQGVAALERLGVNVTVIPAAPRTAVRRLRQMAASSVPDMALRLASPALRGAVDAALKATPFDIVHIAGLEMAEAATYAMSSRWVAPSVILDAFNAEYLLQRRAFASDAGRPWRWPKAAYSLVQWRKLRRYEMAVCHACDAVLAMSSQDRLALAPLCGGTPITVAPHGVDTERYAPLPGGGSGPPTALFIGTLDYRPNVDAAEWLARQVWPLLRKQVSGARLQIVGRDPAPSVRALAAPDIEVTGAVPDDLAYFQQATAFVLPMRFGGGVRLKLLQALSAGLPVVTTRMGAEGVDLTHGVDALLADQPGEFAAALVSALTDRAMAARLGAAGRARVQRDSPWEHTAAIVERCWAALAAPMRQPAGDR